MATYYELAEDTSPSAVYYNGTALAEAATRGALGASGWVDEVESSGRLYVKLAGSDTPYNGTLQVFYTFRFATTPKVINAQYYEARVDGLPNLSQRIEPTFYGVTQIGGGSLDLSNTDGFFNNRRSYQWDAGTTTIRMGVDVLQPDGTWSEMAWSDYEVIGTWDNGAHQADAETFTLDLVERKNRLRKKLPTSYYEITTYPFLESRAIGKPIPLAYGQIYSARPTCTNTFTRTFKLASHAIYSIDEVRYLDATTNEWTAITPTSTDLATATFVLPTDWNGRDEIAVDFRGRKNADGTLMDNPAAIVRDLLEQAGETTTTYDATSFTTAITANVYATDVFGAPLVRAPAYLFVDTTREVLDLVEVVNKAGRAYLYTSAAGKYYYKRFAPQPGNALVHYTTADILDFSYTYNHERVVGSLRVAYARRYQEGYTQAVQVTDATVRYAHGTPDTVLGDDEVNISDGTRALYWAQRELLQRKVPLRVFTVVVPWKGILAPVGSQVRITYDENGETLDAVLEVLGHSVNLDKGTVKLTLGDQHGMGECGFTINASDVLPTSFASLTGYAAGATAWGATWDDQIRTWAKQNIAYALDSNGLASTADAESALTSKAI